MQVKIISFIIILNFTLSFVTFSQAKSIENHLWYDEKTGETFYEVQNGDSLHTIAIKYLKYLMIYENSTQVNEFVSLLSRINRIDNPDLINTKQPILLPETYIENNRLKHTNLLSSLIESTTKFDEYEKRQSALFNELKIKNEQLLIEISSLQKVLTQEKEVNVASSDKHFVSEEKIEEVNSSIQLLNTNITDYHNHNKSLFIYLSIFGLIFLILIIMIAALSFYWSRKIYFIQNIIVEEQKHSIEKTSNEIQKTYDSVVEMISDTMKSLQYSLSQPDEEDKEIDHSLPIRVGEEIHRMRKRLENMPKEIKGLDALKKALERLEDEFNNKGYEIYDLLGKPFVDGLTVHTRFIPSDTLAIGETIITKVIKPQINFNNVIIQVAEVEVSTGG